MHVLGLSIAVSMSTTGFAEIIMNSSAATPQSSLSWSSEQANQFLNDGADADEPSPLGSTLVTTTIRSQSAPAAVQEPAKTVQILDTKAYGNQPSVNARSALVMDAQTGEVLYSKNSNMAVPIASITKLMTAVVTSDARLNMSEKITLQQGDFSCSGCKKSSSTLRAGD